MAFDRTNKGELFSNKDNKKTEKQPDYRGKININGEEFELAAWIRESERSGKWLSLSVRPKDEPRPPIHPSLPKAPTGRGNAGTYQDEDIPF